MYSEKWIIIALENIWCVKQSCLVTLAATYVFNNLNILPQSLEKCKPKE